jgi:hypothetical protein
MASVCLVILFLVMSLSGFMFVKDSVLMFFKPSFDRVKDICFSGVVVVACIITISQIVLLNNTGGV